MSGSEKVPSDVELLINRKSNNEGEIRHAWLEKHQNASSIVFDVKTGVPHQAIYEYPFSTLAQEETLKAFFEAVEQVRRAEGR